MIAMVNQAPSATTRRSRTRLLVQAVLSLVLVVAIFYYLRRKIDPAQTWAVIAAMTGLELTILGLLAVWNLCTYAFVWMTVTPGLGFRRAMAMTQATTAVANTVPGGSAIGVGMTYSMLGSWGYSRSRATTAVLVSGVWNSFIKLGLPVLALALVALQGGATGRRVIAAVTGIAGLVAAIVIFALMLRSDEEARRFGLLAGRAASRLRGLVGRPPVSGWELATVKFRARTIGLVEHRWRSITVWSLVSHLSLCGAAGGPARCRGQRRRGLMGAGAGRVRLRPPCHRHPADPRRGRVRGGRAGDRAGRGGRRPGPGGRRGGGLPGVDLGAADPGRDRLLPVVATTVVDGIPAGGTARRKGAATLTTQPAPPDPRGTGRANRWSPPHGS
jgi:Lysylphosphatidylglycerol synthase TM region